MHVLLSLCLLNWRLVGSDDPNGGSMCSWQGSGAPKWSGRECCPSLEPDWIGRPIGAGTWLQELKGRGRTIQVKWPLILGCPAWGEWFLVSRPIAQAQSGHGGLRWGGKVALRSSQACVWEAQWLVATLSGCYCSTIPHVPLHPSVPESSPLSTCCSYSLLYPGAGKMGLP
jgi:hypothetical protein